MRFDSEVTEEIEIKKKSYGHAPMAYPSALQYSHPVLLYRALVVVGFRTKGVVV